MSVKENLLYILKAEYGITTIQELEQALESLGGVDITSFCHPVKGMNIDQKNFERAP